MTAILGHAAVGSQSLDQVVPPPFLGFLPHFGRVSGRFPPRWKAAQTLALAG